MHKYELLRQRAEEFKFTLEKYAKQDSDVEWLLEKFMPWYERIQKKEIRLPCHEFPLGVYFANPDISPLAERYGFGASDNLLVTNWVRFEEAICDDLSSPIYLEQLRARGDPPSAILDELPPPEEEAPLPEPEKSAEPTGLRGLLHRWLRKP